MGVGMKHLLLAVLFTTPTVTHAQVEVEKDRFTGITTITTTHTPKLDGTMRPKGIVTIKDGELLGTSIMLIGVHDNWRYLQCNSTHWLIDGKRVSLPEPVHNGDVLDGGYVAEILLILNTGIDIFQQIGDAGTVEFKVCNDVYKFTHENIGDFYEASATARTILSAN